MEILKHNPHAKPVPTDHTGKLREADVDESYGGRFGERFRSLIQMILETRLWVTRQCNAFRVESPRWSGSAVPLNLKPLIHETPIVKGNRLDKSLAFICNRAGLYHVSALFAGQLQAGTLYHPRLALIVNGGWYSWLDAQTGVTDHWVLQGSDLVPLSCGDRLEIAFWYAPGGLATINWSSVAHRYGYFGAHWECDTCMTVDRDAIADALDPTFGEALGI